MPSSSPSKDPAAVSKHTFVLFLLMAPACVLCIIFIILVSQYKEFRALVSPQPEVQAVDLGMPQRIRLRNIIDTLRLFVSESAAGAQRSDSLWFDATDLDALLGSSPVTQARGLRFRVEVQDSLLVVITTQPVSSMQGKVSWIFRKIARDQGYLNSEVRGTLVLGATDLKLDPESGTMNGQRFPMALLDKRGGFSAADYVDPDNELYTRLLRVLTRVEVVRGRMLLVRRA